MENRIRWHILVASIGICVGRPIQTMFVSHVARTARTVQPLRAAYARYPSSTASEQPSLVSKTQVSRMPATPTRLVPLPLSRIYARTFHTSPTSFFGDWFNRLRGKPTAAERDDALAATMFTTIDTFVHTPSNDVNTLSIISDLKKSIQENRFKAVFNRPRGYEVKIYTGNKKVVQWTILDTLVDQLLPSRFFVDYDASTPYGKYDELKNYMTTSKVRFEQISDIATAFIGKGARFALDATKTAEYMNEMKRKDDGLSTPERIELASLSSLGHAIEFIIYDNECEKLFGRSEAHTVIRSLLENYLRSMKPASVHWDMVRERIFARCYGKVSDQFKKWQREQILERYEHPDIRLRWRKDPYSEKEKVEQYNVKMDTWDTYTGSTENSTKQQQTRYQQFRQDEFRQWQEQQHAESQPQEGERQKSYQPQSFFAYQKEIQMLKFPSGTTVESLTVEKIKEQYHALALEYHPDILQGKLKKGLITQQVAQAMRNKFREVNAAADVLLKLKGQQ